MQWHPIESVPKKGLVWLRAANVEPVVMCWSERRQMWVGVLFCPIGPARTFWDTSVCEPTEWAHV